MFCFSVGKHQLLALLWLLKKKRLAEIKLVPFPFVIERIHLLGSLA